MSTPESMSVRLASHGFETLGDEQQLANTEEFGVEPLPFRVSSLPERELGHSNLECSHGPVTFGRSFPRAQGTGPSSLA